MQKMDFIKKNSYIVILMVSSIVGILFLSSCSKLFPWYMPDDSDIFLTIGKYWSSGECIPYLDLFDHKGPIIFFINAIGFIIGGGQKIGVAAIEICFLFISEIFAYKILRLKLDKGCSIILTAMMPILFLYNFVPGNFTEEYMLPFLFISFYLFLKWQQSNINTHNPMHAIVYGAAFGFALMTRVTNALSVCLIVILIVIRLITTKQWKNLFKNALCFIIGTAIMVVPFCIYFANKGALYDMWYATLLYNFDYTSNSKLSFEFTLKDIVLLARMTFAGLLTICVCLYKTMFEKDKDCVEWLIVVVFSTSFMFVLERFANYSLILLPFLYVALLKIHNIVNNKKIENSIIICAILLLVLSSLIKINKLSELNNRATIEQNKEYTILLKLIPKNEIENHFVTLDQSTDFYLEENIKPCCKYFIFQNWQSSNSDVLKEQELNEYRNNKEIHYLLVQGDGVIFKNIIKECFVSIGNTNNYNLYKRIK